jgi:hypothetical protein
MASDPLEIVAAKVALLEQLVRALLKQEFLKASDPPAEAHGYAEHLKQIMEQGIGQHHHATILMTENIDLFFDALVRDLKVDLGRPKF